MSKKKKITNTENKLVKSINKNVRSSTRKLKPILKSIVGKKVDIAIRDLTFSEKRISNDVKKTISSAVANAENNFQYDIDKLFIKEEVSLREFLSDSNTSSRDSTVLISILSKTLEIIS